jgi:hypothetical protein
VLKTTILLAAVAAVAAVAALAGLAALAALSMAIGGASSGETGIALDLRGRAADEPGGILVLGRQRPELPAA